MAGSDTSEHMVMDYNPLRRTRKMNDNPTPASAAGDTRGRSVLNTSTSGRPALPRQSLGDDANSPAPSDLRRSFGQLSATTTNPNIMARLNVISAQISCHDGLFETQAAQLEKLKDHSELVVNHVEMSQESIADMHGLLETLQQQQTAFQQQHEQTLQSLSQDVADMRGLLVSVLKEVSSAGGQPTVVTRVPKNQANDTNISNGANDTKPSNGTNPKIPRIKPRRPGRPRIRCANCRRVPVVEGGELCEPCHERNKISPLHYTTRSKRSVSKESETSLARPSKYARLDPNDRPRALAEGNTIVLESAPFHVSDDETDSGTWELSQPSPGYKTRNKLSHDQDQQMRSNGRPIPRVKTKRVARLPTEHHIVNYGQQKTSQGPKIEDLHARHDKTLQANVSFEPSDFPDVGNSVKPKQLQQSTTAPLSATGTQFRSTSTSIKKKAAPLPWEPREANATKGLNQPSSGKSLPSARTSTAANPATSAPSELPGSAVGNEKHEQISIGGPPLARPSTVSPQATLTSGGARGAAVGKAKNQTIPTSGSLTAHTSENLPNGHNPDSNRPTSNIVKLAIDTLSRSKPESSFAKSARDSPQRARPRKPFTEEGDDDANSTDMSTHIYDSDDTEADDYIERQPRDLQRSPSRISVAESMELEELLKAVPDETDGISKDQTKSPRPTKAEQEESLRRQQLNSFTAVNDSKRHPASPKKAVISRAPTAVMGGKKVPKSRKPKSAEEQGLEPKHISHDKLMKAIFPTQTYKGVNRNY